MNFKSLGERIKGWFRIFKIKIKIPPSGFERLGQKQTNKENDEQVQNMKPKFSRKKTIWISAIALVTVLLVIGGLSLAATIDTIKNNPLSLFSVVPQETRTPKPAATPAPTGTANVSATASESASPAPTASGDPYENLAGQADNSLTNGTGTVNVLLIGVDWATEREGKEYSGKYFNSDVMMLLAIHFSEGKMDKCDMISFPRDSYARIHNMEGIYKMNFALSAGGGINERGFMNVCKTVQDQLGGEIPVDYYISVTMQAVKDLANAIGGVEYNMDVNFTINDRTYKKGMQHMDGQAVLDYMRVRKGELSSGFGDLNRVNRQKSILMAIFKKIKSDLQLADVPRILMSVSGCQTNLTLPQLAAFAYHAKDLSEKNISANTLTGTYAYGIFNKNYVLINQAKRIELIQKIFNKTVEPQYKYAPEYAKLQWAYMQGEAWTDVITHVLETDSKLVAPNIVDPDLTSLRQAVTDTNKMMDKYRSTIKSSKPIVKTSEYTEMQNQVKNLQALAKTIFAKTGYSKVNWYVNVPEILKMKE
jgi:LCP family protein required for cell wall assembly